MAITEEQKNELVFDKTPVEETPKKKMPKGAKVALFVVGGIVGTLLLTWAGANLIKYPLYADYWKRQQNLYEIPGLNEGKVPQGCAYDKINKVFYTSEYTTEQAYVYAVSESGSIAHPLTKNGKAFDGHVGGISTSGEYAFIADDDHIYTVKTADLLSKDVGSVEIGEGTPVNNQASFTYANNDYLWVGEFNNDGQYKTTHPVGNNKAIITKYAVSDFYPASTGTTPLEIISIPNEVQGAAFYGNTMVLSTSWALNSSKFIIYDTAKFQETTVEFDGVKVKETNQDPRIIKAPLMMEDLDILEDGTIVTVTESACNKYIVGKFLFYTTIISCKID